MSYSVKTKDELIRNISFLRRKVRVLREEKRKLQEREKQLTDIIRQSLTGIAFNASPNPMFISSIDEGRMIEINERFIELSGYKREEIIGKTSYELNLWFEAGQREKCLLLLREQGSLRNFEISVRLKSSHKRVGLLSAVTVTVGGQHCMIGIFNDITKRKRAEKLLQESNERYRLLFENTPAGIYEIDFVNLKFENVNELMCEYTGFSKEELLSISPLDILSEESKKHFCERITGGFLGKRAPKITEFKIKRKDGTEFWAIINARYKYDSGVPVGATVVAHDITERKAIEETLKKNERFLANIFESIQDRLSIIDTKFNIVRVNKKVEQIFTDFIPLIGKKCYSVYYGRKEVCDGCPSLHTFRTGKAANAVIPIHDSGGNVIRWLEHYSYPLVDEKTSNLQGVIVYARNITEKIKTEKEIIRLDRLNLVGEMAASIGHEIRNPMTAVRGLLEIIKSKAECSVYREHFSVMIDELDRANSIINEFLSLAKNKPVELKNLNLNSIIRSISPLITANAINSKIDIEYRIGDIHDLLLNEKDIRQLIHNLVRNGIDAMSPGGKLVIGTNTEGDRVVLMVKDQGAGINNELIDNIGTPFFTTKENGTGLGLAVCYGIANRHNASINFVTGPEGTTFYVKFEKAE
ncbi:MAG: PAS domain S-box protein [Bacillota bacterium]